MRTAAAVLLLFLAATPPAYATVQNGPPASVEDWPPARVQQLGRAIYDQDVAAARATDALLARFAGQTPPGLSGWIVVGEGRDQTVRFLSGDAENVQAAYDVRVLDGQAGEVREAADTALPPEQVAMFLARQTAARNIGELRCTPRYNAVVLKDPDGESWLVWLLASTTRADQVVLTGHYRFRISADGRQLQRRDQLSASCLVQDLDPPDGARPAGLVVSHIVSPGPLETHVFTSLLYRTPVYVSAGDRLFAVEGDRIRRVRR